LLPDKAFGLTKAREKETSKTERTHAFIYIYIFIYIYLHIRKGANIYVKGEKKKEKPWLSLSTVIRT
jgi:hypothetical protein